MAHRARLRTAQAPHFSPYGPLFPRALLYAVLTALLVYIADFQDTSALYAQTTPVPSAAAPYTLHVYEDLLQLPTLVLDSAQKSYRGLTASQFTLQLDGGPPFHPRHIRLEGDDPLQVALVFDASRESTLALAQKVGSATPGKLDALGTWLSPADHYSLYALDCHLIRTAAGLPYSAARVEGSLAAALAARDLHRHDANAACGNKRRLWESLATVVSQLSQLPGRRVLLVVSDGLGDTSQLSPKTLGHYAGRFNTTLVGLRAPHSDPRSVDPMNRSPFFALPTEQLVRSEENVFELLCGETGGVVLPVDSATMLEAMSNLIGLLRGRYILEFSRPRNDTPGVHHVEVTIPDRHAVVLSAGIAFPTRNPAQDTGPGTVPSDPTRDPQVGNRKILPGPQ